jgi:ABC-type Na+ transport system ATPase subunit NatA
MEIIIDEINNSKTKKVLTNTNATFMLKYLENPKLSNSDKFLTLCKKYGFTIPNDISKYCSNIDIFNNLQKEKKDKIMFTCDQKRGILEIINFIKSDNVYTFGLYGYAGTGKTTVLVELLSYLISNNFVSSIAFTAPTNKAMNVMKSKMKENIKDLYKEKTKNDEQDLQSMLEELKEMNYKIDFLTIHRLLNYKNEFTSEGERIFIKTENNTMKNYDVIVIDECSMISVGIVSDIFHYIATKRKLPKIIFSGDQAQLPSVNELVSSVFLTEKTKHLLTFENYLVGNNVPKNMKTAENEEKFNKLVNNIMLMKNVTMQEIMRTKIDNVIKLCMDVRNWIENDKVPDFGKYKNIDGVKIYARDNNSPKTESKWFKKFIKYHEQNSGNIILTWTNEQTNSYNTAIRKHLFCKDDNKEPNKYEVGDVLIISDFYNFDESSVVGSDNKTRFYTSEQIKIVKIDVTKSEPKSFDTVEFKDIDFFEEIPDILEQVTQVVYKINNKIKHTYAIYSMTIKRMFDTKENSQDAKLNVLHSKSFEELEKDKLYSESAIKKFRTEILSSYGDYEDIIDKLVVKVLWKQWNKIFNDQFANVAYGNAHSVHKSQGSSFYNVFVDADDILNNPRLDEAKRCLYTALSRASNELHIII